MLEETGDTIIHAMTAATSSNTGVKIARPPAAATTSKALSSCGPVKTTDFLVGRGELSEAFGGS